MAKSKRSSNPRPDTPAPLGPDEWTTMLHECARSCVELVLSFKLGNGHPVPLLESKVSCAEVKRKGGDVVTFVYSVPGLVEWVQDCSNRELSRELYAFGCRHFYGATAASTGKPAKVGTFRLELFDKKGSRLDESSVRAERKKIDWDEVAPGRDDTAQLAKTNRDLMKNNAAMGGLVVEAAEVMMRDAQESKRQLRHDAVASSKLADDAVDRVDGILGIAASVSDDRERISRREAEVEAGHKTPFWETGFGQSMGKGLESLFIAVAPAVTQSAKTAAQLFDGRMHLRAMRTKAEIETEKRRLERDARRSKKADDEADAAEAAEDSGRPVQTVGQVEEPAQPEDLADRP